MLLGYVEKVICKSFVHSDVHVLEEISSDDFRDPMRNPTIIKEYGSQKEDWLYDESDTLLLGEEYVPRHVITGSIDPVDDFTFLDTSTTRAGAIIARCSELDELVGRDQMILREAQSTSATKTSWRERWRTSLKH